MRRLALISGALAGLVTAWRQWQRRRADAELWQEATAPRDLR